MSMVAGSEQYVGMDMAKTGCYHFDLLRQNLSKGTRKIHESS
jgi:hypothetical protein